MAGIHQFGKIIVRPKAGIYGIIIQKVVFMVLASSEDRVQVDGVEADICNIIKIFNDSPDRTAQLTLDLNIPPSLFCRLSGNLPPSGSEAVRKNIIDNRILNPFWRRYDICPVIEGQLKIFRPVIDQIFFETVPIIIGPVIIRF